MNSKIKYPKNKVKAIFAVAFSAGLFLLGGCGQQEAETKKIEAKSHEHDHGKEELYASIAHSHEEAGETCFICDASKRDKGRLWCREHDRYEDRCWLCHPELEDKSRLWCKEHSLYEDECYLCHPELKEQSEGVAKPSASNEAKTPALFCNEHQVPEAECGICQPELAGSLLPGGDLKVRFVSSESADKAGIRTDLPRMSEAAPVFSAFCEIQYNMNSMAKVTPLAGGVVRNVYKDVGETVVAGEALVELHSAEVASAKSAYLSSVVEHEIRGLAYEREKRLNEQSVTSEKELLEAHAAYRTAGLAANNYKQRLINFGLGEEEITHVENEQDASARLIIRAPFDGTLIERGSVIGEAVEVGHSLFAIADLSTRWLELSIPSDYVGLVQLGQDVQATFSELPGVSVRGSITWVGTSVDPRTRMIRARALVSQDARDITTGLFGEALISTGEERISAIVPSGSIQRHQGSDFVFVRSAPDLFALRRVSLGNAIGADVQVVAGLDARDSVVTDGSFIVMSEFLKSRLGAGCVHD